MLHRQPNEGDQDNLYRYFKKYGPSSRNLIGLYIGALTTVRLDHALERALKSIDMDKLEELVEMARGDVPSSGPPNISHSVILVYPDPMSSIMLAEIISSHVFQLFADRLFFKEWEALVKTYRLFGDINSLSQSAGWISSFIATTCFLSRRTETSA
jgi:hypothetical protein